MAKSLSPSELAALLSDAQFSAADQARIRVLLSSSDPEVLAAIKELIDGRVSRKEAETEVFGAPDVDMEKFCYSSDYLGLPRGSVFPRIMDTLIEIDRPHVRTAWICAGKGSGKSSLVSITMAKGAYLLTRRIRNPAEYFELLPGERIGLINMSISAQQANDVVFGKFLNLLKHSPLFCPNGTPIYKEMKTRIELSNNVHVLSGHSNYRAYFGYNVFRGVVDELSWFTDTELHPVGEEVYQGVLAAASTRFGDDYKVLCVSTPQSKDDPLYSRVDNGLRNGVPLKIEVDGDSYAKVVA